MDQHSSAQLDELLKLAAQGDGAGLGKLLNAHRDELLALAQRELPGQVQSRVSASDVVQITFEDMQRSFGQTRFGNVAEWRAYLLECLRNNILNAARDHLETQKRDARQEISLEQSEQNGAPLRDQIPAPHTSPVERALKNELEARLCAALELLPPDQQAVVRWKHMQGWTVARIADEMQRSEPAVVSLLQRGMTRLRKLLEPDR